MAWPTWHVGCCAHIRADCAARTGGGCAPGAAVVACASAWIVLAPGNQLRAAYCVAVRADARIVLIPSSGLAGLVRLPCAQVCGLCCSHGGPVPPALRLPCVQARGLCWQPATNFAQHTALLCAQARVTLFGVDGRGRSLFRYTHIASPTSTPSASPHTTSRG